ncbi:MAG: FAD-linked oxidase C-terminal domain-containing protein, partial [Planctomycetota bacterium]
MLLPKTVADIVAAVRLCGEYGVPITARGAGTGLSGGCVNWGLQVDCSRHLNRIISIDPQARRAVVEPGVVLDELNAALKPHGLQFPPDVATSSRATVGGMIANNSAGAHSIIYGRTCDHVLAVDVVLSDGSVARWGSRQPSAVSRQPSALSHQPSAFSSQPSAVSPQPSAVSRQPSALSPQPEAGTLAARCEQVVADVLHENADEIAARFPKVMRSNGGYALDRLRFDEPGAPATGRPRLNLEQLICGSEGTLGIIVGATLNLVPLPAHKGLTVVHFETLPEALNAVPAMLAHQPAAVELLDGYILAATKDNVAMLPKRWFLTPPPVGRAPPADAPPTSDAVGRALPAEPVGRALPAAVPTGATEPAAGGARPAEPGAILIVEFYADTAAQVEHNLNTLVADLRARGIGYAWPIITDARQADVWDVRKGGTGLLMSRPGETQPYDFVDDTAVDSARLGDYMARFGQILHEEGIALAGYYGHASVGLLHVRPALNLHRAADVAKLRRIAERVSSLVAEFGGAMTGEHGDGIVRSCWLEKTHGPRLVAAFRRIKEAFDPRGIFNPNKIIDPLPMDEPLRYGAGYEYDEPDTLLDFAPHSGMAGMVQKCEGLGQCRQRLVGTMCPSYQATGDELHTTRARANALRVALSNRGLLTGLADPHLEEVLDLCLACKACKTECPTGVDMARLKAEWFHRRNEREGVSRRTQIVAASVRMAHWGCRFAPLSNWLMQSRALRIAMEYLYGLDRRVPPPRFARQTFRQWFAARAAPIRARAAASGHGELESRGLESVSPRARGPVVYFADTWTNYYLPQVGQAAVKVLEALSYEVLVPPTVCCGRPMISKGLLRDAQQLCERNVAVLAPFAERGIPIVGTEPSCVSVLTDELPQLVRTPAARAVAQHATSLEALIAADLRRDPDALRPNSHAHPRDPLAPPGDPRDLPRDTEPLGCRPDTPHSLGFRPDVASLLFHGHCHQKALTGTVDVMAVLQACLAPPVAVGQVTRPAVRDATNSG